MVELGTTRETLTSCWSTATGLINYFEQRRIDSFGGPTFGAKYVTEDGKRTYIKFRWEGSNLLTDNEATQVHSKYPSAFKINRTLALKMGWLKETSPGNYVLGPNLRQEFFTDLVPDLKNMTHDLEDEHKLGHGNDKPVFWMVDRGLLTLSMTCNWRFMNLDQAFGTVAGTRLRSLFVYSVGGSSVMGNQVTDFSREVYFRRKGEGVQYFEPLHIQYIALRKQVLDIIETHVGETTGDLARFGEENTIVTLHFKRA